MHSSHESIKVFVVPNKHVLNYQINRTITKYEFESWEGYTSGNSSSGSGNSSSGNSSIDSSSGSKNFLLANILETLLVSSSVFSMYFEYFIYFFRQNQRFFIYFKIKS